MKKHALAVINGIVWLFALAILVYAVSKSGRVQDSRTEIITISEPQKFEPGTVNTDEELSTSNLKFSSEPDTSQDEPGTSSAIPQAVLLNDSASFLLSQGENKEAIPFLTRAIALDSAYARAHYNLGLAYHKMNKLGEAIKEYEAAIALRPFYFKPVYNLGLLYFEIGDYQNAEKWFTKAVGIRKSSESAPAHYNLGIVYNRLGNTAAAMDSYKEALRLRPGYAQARYNLALLEMDNENYRSAASHFEKTAALGFKKVKLYKNLGVCYSRLGFPEKAVTAYEHAITLDSSDASLWFNLAVVNNHLKDKKQAIYSYQHAVTLDSSYYEAHFNLAMVFADMDQADSAIAHYRYALTVHPSYSKAAYNLARLYSDIKQYDSAAVYYQYVIDLDPGNLKALFNLGLTYSKLNNYELAASTYRELIDLNPIHEKGLNNLGTTYLKLKEYDSAYVCFNRLVGLTHSPQAYYNRAKASRELGEIDSAAKDYREAIKLKPDYAKAYHNLAILEEKRDNLTEAATLLQQALQYDSENWKTHWKLGQVYYKLGLVKQAKAEYAEAKKALPTSQKFNREYNELFNR